MARNVAVSKLIQYLRIKTVHPEPDYGISMTFTLVILKSLFFSFYLLAAAIAFLKDYAKEIGVDDCREVQV